MRIAERTKAVQARVTPSEFEALQRLSQLEGRRASDTLRGLIVGAARRCGVWPVRLPEAHDMN